MAPVGLWRVISTIVCASPASKESKAVGKFKWAKCRWPLLQVRDSTCLMLLYNVCTVGAFLARWKHTLEHLVKPKPKLLTLNPWKRTLELLVKLGQGIIGAHLSVDCQDQVPHVHRLLRVPGRTLHYLVHIHQIVDLRGEVGGR